MKVEHTGNGIRGQRLVNVDGNTGVAAWNTNQRRCCLEQ